MARKKGLNNVQKFLVIAGALIAVEAVYLAVFSGGTTPVTAREAIQKAVNQQSDLTDQRKEQMKVQLALADFRAKHEKLPGSLDELVPEYFDVVPVDPTSGKQFKYQIVNGNYLLGDDTPRPSRPTAPEGRDGKIDPAVLASLEDDTERAAFVYDPTGKRDPFQPFDFSKTTGAIDPNNPLTAFGIGQLRLTSVLAGFEEPIAIVETSLGKGYTVRKGTKIGPNSGEVVAIEKDRILILETTSDITGEVKSTTIELKLRTKDQEEK